MRAEALISIASLLVALYVAYRSVRKDTKAEKDVKDKKIEADEDAEEDRFLKIETRCTELEVGSKIEKVKVDIKIDSIEEDIKSLGSKHDNLVQLLIKNKREDF